MAPQAQASLNWLFWFRLLFTLVSSLICFPSREESDALRLEKVKCVITKYFSCKFEIEWRAIISDQFQSQPQGFWHTTYVTAQKRKKIKMVNVVKWELHFDARQCFFGSLTLEYFLINFEFCHQHILFRFRWWQWQYRCRGNPKDRRR